jgi:hypothetical protein
MQITFNITHATVLRKSGGADVVFIFTEHPSPMPSVSDQPLSFKFEVTVGEGVNYVKNNFNIEPEMIYM